jgi:hypothetical protein
MATEVFEMGRPGRMLEAITPHNSTNFTNGTCRAIYVGVGGTMTIVTPDGSPVQLVGTVTGSIIPVQAIRVNSTGTAASSLVAIY